MDALRFPENWNASKSDHEPSTRLDRVWVVGISGAPIASEICIDMAIKSDRIRAIWVNNEALGSCVLEAPDNVADCFSVRLLGIDCALCRGGGSQ